MEKKALKIIRELERRYPERGFFGSRDPFQALVSTVLSQRTRDENTAKASRKLFSRFSTPKELAEAPVREIEALIKKAGFYRVKARKLKEISRIILEKHKGKVPRDLEGLMKLPGVGRKTASCVLLYGFGKPCIPVDVHVAVISRRLGLSSEKEPGKIQDELERIVPGNRRARVNDIMVRFGQEICRTAHPKCGLCWFRGICRHYSGAER